MDENKIIEILSGKLDKIDEKCNNIHSTLSAQHVTLKEHHRRSLALESQVEILKKEVGNARAVIGTIAKACGILVGGATLVAAIMEIINYGKGHV
jgi:hypothetical protein